MSDDKNNEQTIEQLNKIQEDITELKREVSVVNRKLGLEDEPCIQSALKNIDRQFKMGGDDQVFLGFALAFCTIFFSLQYGDIAGFFKSIGSNPLDTSVLVFKWGSFSFFLAAIIVRYYSTLVDDSKPLIVSLAYRNWKSTEVYNSFTFRYLSLEFLFIGLEFIAVVLIITLSTFYHDFSFISTMFLVLILSILALEKFEDRMLGFYTTKGLIPKGSEPMAKMVFAPIAIMVVMVLLVPLIVLDVYYLPQKPLAFPQAFFYPGAFRAMTLLWIVLCGLLFRRIKRNKPKTDFIDDYSI